MFQHQFLMQYILASVSSVKLDVPDSGGSTNTVTVIIPVCQAVPMNATSAANMEIDNDGGYLEVPNVGDAFGAYIPVPLKSIHGTTKTMEITSVSARVSLGTTSGTPAPHVKFQLYKIAFD